MSKKNTPISDKIKEIQDGIDKLPTSQRIIAEGMIDLLKTILPAERQAIEQAYRREIVKDNGDIEYFNGNTSASDYFTETYEI